MWKLDEKNKSIDYYNYVLTYDGDFFAKTIKISKNGEPIHSLDCIDYFAEMGVHINELKRLWGLLIGTYPEETYEAVNGSLNDPIRSASQIIKEIAKNEKINQSK